MQQWSFQKALTGLPNRSSSMFEKDRGSLHWITRLITYKGKCHDDDISQTVNKP